MKCKKNLLLLTAVLVSGSMLAMETPLKPREKEEIVVKEFEPRRYKREVLNLVKRNWPSNFSGEYDETFVCDHIINPVHPGEVLKYVDVALDTNAPEGSKVQGVVTSLYFPEDKRGNIEILISNPEFLKRKEVELALLLKAFENLNASHPAKIDKHVKKTNEFTTTLFKKFGFKPVKENAEWTVFEWHPK